MVVESGAEQAVGATKEVADSEVAVPEAVVMAAAEMVMGGVGAAGMVAEGRGEVDLVEEEGAVGIEVEVG